MSSCLKNVFSIFKLMSFKKQSNNKKKNLADQNLDALLHYLFIYKNDNNDNL